MSIRLEVAKLLLVLADSDFQDTLLDLAVDVQAAGYHTHYLAKEDLLLVSHYDSDRQFMVSIVDRGGDHYFSIGQTRKTDAELAPERPYSKPTLLPVRDNQSTIFQQVIDFIKKTDGGTESPPATLASLKAKYPKCVFDASDGLINPEDRSIRMSPPRCSFAISLLPKRDRWQLEIPPYAENLSDNIFKAAVRNLRTIIEHGLTTSDLLGPTGERVIRLLRQADLAAIQSHGVED